MCRTADLRGKALVLIDDELTTGATVEDCWRVLKRAGAGRVKVLTLARGALVKLMAKKEEYGQG